LAGLIATIELSSDDESSTKSILGLSFFNKIAVANSDGD
jgi:hypothetical protein